MFVDVSVKAADYFNTSWAPSASITSTGSGTLNAIPVSIVTAAVGANAGITFNQDWDTIFFVNNAGFTNINPGSAISLGYDANTNTTQSVSFGGSGVTNPYYLVNWTEAGSSFTFPLTPTYFSGSGANLAGNVVTVSGTESDNTGFIVGFTGTFASLNFVANRSGQAETMLFSVIVPVPEPSTWALGGLSALAAVVMKRRQTRAAEKSAAV